MSEQVVIAGGAIMGSFAAWFLRREGFAGDITVVEKDPTYRFCSTALSAAAIRTQFGTPVNIHMSLFGVDFFRRIKQTFGPKADIGYVENGYLILGSPETSAARSAGAAMQRAEGADVLTLTPDDIAQRFPYMSMEGVGITLTSVGAKHFVVSSQCRTLRVPPSTKASIMSGVKARGVMT